MKGNMGGVDAKKQRKQERGGGEKNKGNKGVVEGRKTRETREGWRRKSKGNKGGMEGRTTQIRVLRNSETVRLQIANHS